MNWHGKRYHSLNSFFLEHFNEKVYRVALDAGFTCPNRDGTKGTGGCIYCNEEGSRASYVDPKKSVKEQLKEGIRLIHSRTGAKKFIAYFQAYTNTYHDDVDFLEKLYTEALNVPDVVGLSIGTRPDCVPDPVLDMLEKIAENHYVLLEFGAQSMKDSTLKDINRRHSAADMTDAVTRVKKRAGIDVLAQVIFGLPKEKTADMKNSVLELVRMGVNAFKFHHLYVEKNTLLEKLYYAEKLPLLTLEEYLEILCAVIPLLPERVVLHRLFGQCSKETLVAPHWTLDKNANLEKLEKLLEERKIMQGSAFLPVKV
jgi:uncharacterized protein